MRQLTIFLSLLLSSSLLAQNKLVPKFDERIELLSVVFRLAESPEYINNSIKLYSDSVDAYFNQYKNHEVVKLAQKLRKKNGVAYDAVMSMAIHLRIDNNTIRFDESLTRKNLDNRWGKYSDNFVTKLSDFYSKSEFKQFFNRNKPLYEIAEERFGNISQSLDIEWFENFYGYQPKGKYHIVLSLLNYGNYGPKTLAKSGEENIYSILCAWETDSRGTPKYHANQKGTLVHEFCHSFCNQLGEKYIPQMEPKATEFYKTVSKLMRRQAYGSSQTMINEILVRASTIRYFEDTGVDETSIDRMLLSEQANGFLWIDTLYQSFNNYTSNREKYATLDDFMPQVVSLQNSLLPEELLKNYNSNCPRIISSSITNGAKDVSPSLSEIIIEYDRPMASYGISDKGNPPELEVEWKDQQHTILSVKVVLESDTDYALHFHPPFNVDRYKFPLKESFKLKFKTKK
ncbi:MULTISPECIES: DUF4932 domain-containing protein [unclassified Carboxylicivirga]|uniref:DUF4932 domain-containing protein n=1 Tax=Carboxylicivirga TaxID=1628153 RepID=UPI003D3284AE